MSCDRGCIQRRAVFEKQSLSFGCSIIPGTGEMFDFPGPGTPRNVLAPAAYTFLL
jgi:hypothetical protein